MNARNVSVKEFAAADPATLRAEINAWLAQQAETQISDCGIHFLLHDGAADPYVAFVVYSE